jgi:hypothetical protein
MKLGHRTTALIAFAAGACLFVTTAFADMLLGSGYDRLKSAVKTTAAQMESGLGSFTMETMYSLEIDGRPYMHTSETVKVDQHQPARETVSVDRDASGTIRQSYHYQDRNLNIWKSSEDPVYYVTEFPEDFFMENWTAYDNPFDDEHAEEIEKIFDALVGNLKDHVHAQERMEGGIAYSGSLSAAQVPPLVNAVTSFLFKQGAISHYRYRGEDDSDFPKIEKDIYVKSVSGSAVENGDGLLESLNGEIVLNGKDESGAQHEIVFRLAFKLTSIGATVVAMPDLDNAQVEKSQGWRYPITSKHVGVYKNDIIMEKGESFVKIGERTLEIVSVEDSIVKGRFRETVYPGYEQEYPEAYDFEFELDQSPNRHWNFFTYTDPSGVQRYGQLHPGSSGRMYVDVNIETIDENSYSAIHRDHWHGDFYRVFE